MRPLKNKLDAPPKRTLHRVSLVVHLLLTSCAHFLACACGPYPETQILALALTRSTTERQEPTLPSATRILFCPPMAHRHVVLVFGNASALHSERDIAMTDLCSSHKFFGSPVPFVRPSRLAKR
jgi:hypothetical protein